MSDYMRRFAIAIIMAICVSLLFLGGRQAAAEGSQETNKKTQLWIWPTDGVISDTYGTRQGKHKGIDIAGNVNTPILAVESGVVEKSYRSTTYGNVVFIKHPSGFVTVYAHLNKRLAGKGQKVNQGDVIGKLGNTGQSTGPHLHFEVHQQEWRYDKKFAFNPEKLLGETDVGESVKGGVARGSKDVLEVMAHLQQERNKDASQKTNKTVQAVRYTVKQGDTLYGIAKKNKISVEKIKRMNNLSTDLIKPKQVLTIR